MRRKMAAFTLAELMVTVTVITLLLGILVPSFQGIRKQARLAACASSMRAIHTGLLSYALSNKRCFPPFAFADSTTLELPASIHWGGTSQDRLYRIGTQNVNLWPLVREGFVDSGALVCPGSSGGQGTSYFSDTQQYSTYCLRFPTSADLFAEESKLGNMVSGKKLWIYTNAVGGQSGIACGNPQSKVPLVRLDRRYLVDLSNAALAPGYSNVQPGYYDPSVGAILSDTFWRDNYQDNPPAPVGKVSYPVRWNWCHDKRFNVLTGTGAVRTVEDDGTVFANSNQGNSRLADDGVYFASYAERVWQFFEARR